MNSAKEQRTTTRHTKKLDEIMSQPPSWWLRSGISSVFLTTIFLLVGTYFIEIDETTQASFTQEGGATEKITSKVSGRISNVMVHNGDTIAKNTLLLLFDTEASAQEISMLFGMLKVIDTVGFDPVAFEKLPKLSKLGELQGSFDRCRRAYSELKNSLVAEGDLLKKSGPDNNLKRLLQEYKVKSEQSHKLQSERNPSKNDREIELESALLYELNRNLQLLEYRIYLLKSNVSKSSNNFHLKYFRLLKALIRDSEKWKNRYALFNHKEGVVWFTRPLKVSSQVEDSQHLFNIASSNQIVSATFTLPSNLESKVRLGGVIRLRTNGVLLFGKITSVVANQERSHVLVKAAIVKVPASKTLSLNIPNSAEVFISKTSLFSKIWKNIITSKKLDLGA